MAKISCNKVHYLSFPMIYSSSRFEFEALPVTQQLAVIGGLLSLFFSALLFFEWLPSHCLLDNCPAQHPLCHTFVAGLRGMNSFSVYFEDVAEVANSKVWTLPLVRGSDDGSGVSRH